MDESSTWFPSSVSDSSATTLKYRLIPITPDILKKQTKLVDHSLPTLSTSTEDYVYRVQPRDVLNIIVWEHPELTTPAGEFRPGEEQGRLVREDGTIFYPYAGIVKVAGLTVEEIRQKLVKRLKRFIQDPQVDVRVSAFRSQRVYVTGRVAKPDVLPITDVPLTVLDAINQVGGFSDQANRRVAYLTRDDQRHRIDLIALYEHGDMHQNVVLRDQDVLNIPDNLDNKVFVLGEVGEQAQVYIDITGLTLAEAIAQVKGFDLRTADTRGVYVIRGVPDGELTVYQLDASRATAMMLADGFELQPRDVVFVSTAPLARWNRVIEQILPTVQSLWQTRQLTR